MPEDIITSFQNLMFYFKLCQMLEVVVGKAGSYLVLDGDLQ